MKLYSSFDPIAYVWFADVYCRDCGEKLLESDPEGNEKHPIFGWQRNEFVNCDDGNGGTYDSSCGECHKSAKKWGMPWSPFDDDSEEGGEQE